MKCGGALLCFEMKGGLEQAERFFDHVGWLSHCSNFGDSRTILTHPRHTTHSKLTPEERAAVGISDGLVRIGVGLEHHEDLTAQVLEAVEKSGS